MMQNKLLPCPFCGGEPRYRIYDLKNYTGKHEYIIRCDNCNIQFNETDVYESPFVTKQKVEGKWNTRKPMERIVEQLEDKKEQYNKKADSWAEHSWEDKCVYNHWDINDAQADCYDDAIEIVRKGGVDNAE